MTEECHYILCRVTLIEFIIGRGVTIPSSIHRRHQSSLDAVRFLTALHGVNLVLATTTAL